MQVFAKTLGDFVQNMGATPISLMVTQAYESLQRGVVDATLIGWSDPFRLDEVTSFHLEGPFGVSPHVIAMTRTNFESLSEPAQRALPDNSGEAQSRNSAPISTGLPTSSATPMRRCRSTRSCACRNRPSRNGARPPIRDCRLGQW